MKIILLLAIMAGELCHADLGFSNVTATDGVAAQGDGDSSPGSLRGIDDDDDDDDYDSSSPS